MTEPQVADNLPLFYSNPQPVSSDRHGDWKVKQNRSFAYAARTHAVPVILDEVPLLQAHYPLVFSAVESPALIALMGLRGEENLFVTSDNRWAEGRPVPAYVQRYPFLLLELPEENRLVLILEEDAGVVGRDGDLPLFDKGQGTEFGKGVLDFCVRFNESAKATQAFCAELAKRDLLVDQQADVTTPDGKRLSLTGFRVVDEQRFAALPDDVFLEWRRQGWVGMVYAHLMSLGRLQNLVDALRQRPAA